MNIRKNVDYSSMFAALDAASPRNLRRMRDFYRLYEGSPELKLAMQLGWTQNVVILEAELNTEERRGYLRAAKQFGWSKSELQQAIASAAYLELSLDEIPALCYINNKSSKAESFSCSQISIFLLKQHWQMLIDCAYHKRHKERSHLSAEGYHRICCRQSQGDRQFGLFTGPPQICLEYVFLGKAA